MKAVCPVCFHGCALDEGQTGFCRARANRGGKIVPVNYGKVTSLALDPIEKKPLARFHQGSLILSVGSFGCNLRCPFCQNHEISMAGEDEAEAAVLLPETLVRKAEQLKALGNIGLAYTYNEPLVSWEFVRDCARAVRERGMVNVLVTNGTAGECVLKELLPLIDAANIDLKSFKAETYKKLGGDLESVKRSIALAAGAFHVEVTTLVVPGLNDTEEEIRSIAAWLAGIDRGIPLHLSRFFPRYRMAGAAATPVATVLHFAEIAREYLDCVCTGNI